MKDLSSAPGIQADANYLNGKLLNNQTSVGQFINQDIVQFFQKLADNASIVFNGNFDNEANGYQTIEALDFNSWARFPSPISDADAIPDVSGFYRGNSVTNAPTAEAATNVSIVQVIMSGIRHQMLYGETGIFHRIYDSSWGSWFEIMTTEISTKPKYIDIGAWDMDATGTVNIAHGISSAVVNIESISIKIYNDASALSSDILNSGKVTWDATNVNITRDAGGDFDTANYNDGAMNRGRITINYIP